MTPGSPPHHYEQPHWSSAPPSSSGASASAMPPAQGSTFPVSAALRTRRRTSHVKCSRQIRKPLAPRRGEPRSLRGSRQQEDCGAARPSRSVVQPSSRTAGSRRELGASTRARQRALLAAVVSLQKFTKDEGEEPLNHSGGYRSGEAGQSPARDGRVASTTRWCSTSNPKNFRQGGRILSQCSASTVA